MSGRGEIMVGDKPLSSLRVVDLKAELEKRGLSKSGTKKDLVDRLKANLLLNKDREEAAVSAARIDEGELPNIAAKLPDDNPFVREYLQSQAELFHSQQVAKKLYREEQKRESEGSGASADEREKSPLKSPAKIAESLSPVRHQPDVAVTSPRETEREKLPEKRTRGRPPSSSKSPVRMIEEGKPPEVPVIPEEVETLPLPPPKSPTKEAQPTSPVKNHAEDKVEVVSTRAAEREKSPEKRSTRGRPARSKSPVHFEEVKQDKAPVIPEEEEAPPPKSPVKVVEPTSPVKHQAEEMKEVTSTGDAEREKSPEKEVTKARGAEREKSPDKEVTKARGVECEKSPEKRSTRGRPARTKSPVHVEEDKAPSIPEEEEALPPATSPPKTTKVLEEQKEDVVVEPEKMETDVKSPAKVVPSNDQAVVATAVEVTRSPIKVQEVEVTPDSTDSEMHEEVVVPIIQPTPPQNPPAKRTRIRVAEPEVPVVDTSDKPIVKPRRKIIPIEFNESDLGKPAVKEKKKEKIRSTTAELVKPTNVQAPAPTPETTRRRSSTALEKENSLDEVLDYGEDESADMAEFDEPTTSTSKRPSAPPLPPPKSAPKEQVESPQGDVEAEPIEFERRVINIKPNKHSQRRKEQFEEDRKEREKKRSRRPLVVTTQLMKEWYPDLVMLTTEELKLIEENPPSTPPAEVERKLRITRTISNVESVDMERLQGSGEGEGESVVEEEETAQQEMDLTIQRKISIISMDEEMTKGQTPPRRAPTQLILVTNLVRPFTIPQLKELLQRTGNVLDLWVDKIKSKCVAKYDTEDEAIETRTALHGVKWPLSNPKSLSVDFTTEERVDDLRKKDSGYVEEKPTASQHVREWDVGKNSPPRGHRKRSHSRDKEDRDRDRDRKRSRRTPSPHGHGRRRTRSPHSDRKDRNGDLKKSEASGKTLDELFRKTVATPCIYWLPLNPQQIAEKEELRRKRMEERERRISEMQHQHRPQR